MHYKPALSTTSAVFYAGWIVLFAHHWCLNTKEPMRNYPVLALMEFQPNLRIAHFEALNQPNFNNRLSCYAKFARFSVKRVNHPCSKIDIHPFLPLLHAFGF